MSLFQCRDWWSISGSEAEAQECDEGGICVANIDNENKGGGKHRERKRRRCMHMSIHHIFTLLLLFLCVPFFFLFLFLLYVLLPDKIITGSFSGMLRIFYPRQSGYKIDDLMLEVQLDQPILQLEAGRFCK
jgi:hypothetical protein